jgi:hypothetical protein
MAAKKAEFYPTHWKKWSQAIEDNRVMASPGLNRYAARYRAARLFLAVNVEPEQVSEEWSRGFSALLKVFLAYTAMESLARSLPGRYEDNIKGFSKESVKLAQQIRKNRTLLDFLFTEISNAKLKPKLKAFADSENNDVFWVASAIRHLVAHGTLTVGGANARSMEKAEALLKLADVVMKVSDEKFSEFCSTRLQASSKSGVRS